MPFLRDQIAVVTGASSGIGKAIVLGLAAEGARLCLVGRRIETLEAVAAKARETSPCVRCCRTDLNLDDDIRGLSAFLGQEFGVVDILIHSAGIIFHGQVGDAPVGDFDKQYRVNVRAPYLLTQALLPILKSRRGQIVFINSSMGLNTRATVGQYAATKHALKAVADSLREEVNADGLRVLSMFLGRTASPMQAEVHRMEGKEYYPSQLLQPDDVVATVISALSLPRTAEVTDICIRPLRKS